jgi:DNA polymerase-1
LPIFGYLTKIQNRDIIPYLLKPPLKQERKMELSDFQNYDTVALDFETDIEEDVAGYDVVIFSLCAREGSRLKAHSFDGSKAKHLKSFLKGKKVVCHNAIFELKVLESLGVDIHTVNYEDTMVLGHLLDESRRKGLKWLRKLVLGKPDRATYDEVNKDNMREFKAYNKDDAIDTMELYEKFTPQIPKEGLETVYALEKGVLLPIIEMENTGCLLDLDLREKQEIMLQEFLEEIQVFVDMAAGKQVNLNSTKQLAELYYKILKVNPKEDWATQTGYSTKEAVLQEIQGIYGKRKDKASERIVTVTKKILEARKYNKLLSSFVGETVLENLDEDTRLHGSFDNLGTVTGRFSCRAPNLQQIPKSPFVKDDLETHVRSLFIAPPGRVMVTADYSQIELRMMAEFSRDRPMVDAFLNEDDIHQMTADYIGCSRNDGKMLNFAVCYGIGPQGFSDVTGLPIDKASQYLQSWFSMHPGLSQNMVDIRRMTRQLGYVRTMSGRKRRFPELGEPRLAKWQLGSIDRKSYNTYIQGSSADLMKLALIRIYRALDHKRAQLIMTVHDEISAEVDEDYMEDAYHIIKYEMEHAIKTFIPIEADVKIGRRWSENK